MKQGWEIKKLGEVIQKTETVDPTKKPDIDFLYVDVSSVNNQGFFVESTSTLKGKDAPSRARKLIRTNDVIFATVRPTLKRIAIIEDDLDEQVCSTGYFVLRAKDIINYKLLFYYLLTDGFIAKMESLQKGASYPAVTDGDVRNQTICYPKSLPEQQRIVSILDEAFAAIAKAKANAEQNLRNAKEVFESYLQGVFEGKGEDWDKQSLGEVCLFKGGGTPSTKVKEYWEGKIPWVSPKDMKSKIISNSQDHLTIEAINNSSASLIPKGSILIVVRSGILARIVPIGITEEVVSINQDLKALCPKKNIDSNFLYYFLEGSMRFLLSKVTRGATVHRISTDSLRHLKIGVPNIKVQKSIVQNSIAFPPKPRN